MAKQCVQLNLALLGTVKYNSVTKTIKMFNLIPQIDNLGISGERFSSYKAYLQLYHQMKSRFYVFFWLILIETWVNIIHVIRVFKKMVFGF